MIDVFLLVGAIIGNTIVFILFFYCINKLIEKKIQNNRTFRIESEIGNKYLDDRMKPRWTIDIDTENGNKYFVEWISLDGRYKRKGFAKKSKAQLQVNHLRNLGRWSSEVLSYKFK